VVEKFAGYWAKDHVSSTDHLPADRRQHGALPPPVRRLDLIERVLATDIKSVRDNPKLRLSKAGVAAGSAC